MREVRDAAIRARMGLLQVPHVRAHLAKALRQGRIYSWERVWNPAHPALKDALPYLVVLVELSDGDGIRMVGNLLGDPKQEVRIGAEVEAVFEDHPEHQFTLIQWAMVPGRSR